MMQNAVPRMMGCSHTVTVQIEVPQGVLGEVERLLGAGHVDGVLVAQGGASGGWSLFVENGRVKYAYHPSAHDSYYVEASEPLPCGQVQVGFHFALEGGHGEPATGRLSYNDEVVGEGRIGRTVPQGFSANESLDIVFDPDMPVRGDRPVGGAKSFGGKVNWVRIDLGNDHCGRLVHGPR